MVRLDSTSKLKMEVYSNSFLLLGVLDEFTSLMWDDWAFESGTFTITAPLTNRTRAWLRPEHFVWFEGDAAGIIENLSLTVSETGLDLVAKGNMVKGLLGRRILWNAYNVSDKVSAIMHQAVLDNAVQPTDQRRIVPGMVIKEQPVLVGSNVRVQKTGGGLLEFLEEVGRANNTAYGVDFIPGVGSLQFGFWTRACRDLTVEGGSPDWVLYSTTLDDVLDSSYQYDASQYANVARVAGEGEGSARKIVDIGVEFEGLARRELWVDARDLQSDSDPDHILTPAEYEEVLAERGNQKLADAQLVESFSATVRTKGATYQLGRDFELGDYITVADERLGIVVKAQVEGAERSFSENGEDLILTIGYSMPTLSDKLRKGGL